jgi:flagellar protein FlbD
VENLVIELTRLNNQRFAVNSDLIKFVENAHDTVITLMNDEKLVVREPVEEVIARIIAFRQAILAGLPSAAAHPSSSGYLPNSLNPSDLRAKGQGHG